MMELVVEWQNRFIIEFGERLKKRNLHRMVNRLPEDGKKQVFPAPGVFITENHTISQF
ncbi:TPA: hypothetical protein ABRA27_004514 [Escherichia coli]